MKRYKRSVGLVQAQSVCLSGKVSIPSVIMLHEKQNPAVKLLLAHCFQIANAILYSNLILSAAIYVYALCQIGQDHKCEPREGLLQLGVQYACTPDEQKRCTLFSILGSTTADLQQERDQYKKANKFTYGSFM